MASANGRTSVLPVRIIRITDLNDPRADEAAELLQTGFAESVVGNAVVGGRDDLKQMAFRAIVNAEIVGGQLYLLINEEDDKAIGTAAWYPPGIDYLTDEEQLRVGSDEFFEHLKQVEPGLYDYWVQTYIPALSNVSNKYLATSPDENIKLKYWTFYSFTVLKEYRGRGLGRMLMKIGEDQAAARGETCCVETDSEENRTIYTKMGYTHMGFDPVPAPPGLQPFEFHVFVKTPTF